MSEQKSSEWNKKKKTKKMWCVDSFVMVQTITADSVAVIRREKKP